MTVESTQPRTKPITDEERLFDLIPAAWGMDDCTFEKVAGFPEGWMWKWRNHYLVPTIEQLKRIRRLAAFHDSIRLIYTRPPHYQIWWRKRWRVESLIGNQTPLEAVLADNHAFLDRAEKLFRVPN